MVIPKGEIADGEDVEVAARREPGGDRHRFLGIARSARRNSRAWRQTGDRVRGQGDVDVQTIRSNTFEIDGRQKVDGCRVSEIDRAEWFDLPSAREGSRGQRPLLDRLAEFCAPV